MNVTFPGREWESHITAQLDDIVPSRHSHTEVLGPISAVRFQEPMSFHTTVMGMLGALGKMKATSSNLLRRRQF